MSYIVLSFGWVQNDTLRLGINDFFDTYSPVNKICSYLSGEMYARRSFEQSTLISAILNISILIFSFFAICL